MKAPSWSIPANSPPESPHLQPAPAVPGNAGVKAEIFITINRPPEELFAFWRNFENLPRVMKHVESVRATGTDRSHWRVKVSADNYLEWDAQIINEKRNEMIAWRTLEGSDVQHAGSIWFKPAPGGVGTEVKLAVEYHAGKFADFMFRILRRSPEQQMREDLRHFKQLMEAGEIPTTAGQSASRTEDITPKYQESQ